ncbi:MAG: DUF5777 family beta-barrel protein [Bacteroidales bacterium]|nr:DUF5777 family beta-barrel protein [Bacteroidales bacterium]MCF8457843.1 DUF5777 family beta-barrel protein [Bacteroidales bacterium]
MKKMVYKRISILAIGFLFAGMSLFAQEDKQEDKPVRFAWNSELLIDNQTPLMQNEKTWQFHIHHRFGTLENGISDLYGIYAPSNIRIGLNYGVTSKLTIGFGTEKNNKMQELMWKVKLLEQTRSWRIPIDLTYFGNVVIDGREEENFGTDFTFTNRLSFFNQLIVSSKLTDKLSLMCAVGYAHFNALDTAKYDGMAHDKLGITFGGRYNFHNEMSFIIEYDHPIDIYGDEEEPAKPNLGIGWEINTGTHAFQVTAANYSHIINQKNLIFNRNDMTNGGWLIGFNIVVRF